MIGNLFGRGNSGPVTAPPVSAEMLVAAGIHQDKIDAFLAPLNAACNQFDIVTPQRVCAFLAQVAWESDDFKYTSEIWGPTAQQQRYDGRTDLGNSTPGDGYKYRGRGLIQITGRANYSEVSTALYGTPQKLLYQPELLEQTDAACLSAAWWWFRHGLNELADVGDFVAITKRINGGTATLPQRMAIWKTICRAAGI
jgi:putative chitinase